MATQSPNINPYNQPQLEKPSLARQGANLLWEYNKFRMWSGALSGKSMQSMAMGKGMKSPGMVGVRGILSGARGPGGSFWNPVRGIMEETIRITSGQTPAARFRSYGLFGKSTVGNVSRSNIGTGLLRAGKDSSRFSKMMTSGMNIFGGGTGIFQQQSVNDYYKNLRKTGVISDVPAKKLRSFVKSADYARGSTRQAIRTVLGGGLARKELTKKFADVKTGKLTAAGTELMKYSNKAALLKIGATVGRAVNILGWTTLAYTGAKALTQGVAGFAGTAASILEDTANQFGNTQMEFGGRFESGFFSTQAATERQRALKLIGQTGLRARSQAGNEAGMSHVGSTW